MLCLIFFFLNEIFNIEFHIYLDISDNAFNISINNNMLYKDYNYKFENNIFYYMGNGKELDNITISYVNNNGNNGNNGNGNNGNRIKSIGGFIQLENNCIFNISNKYLVSFNITKKTENPSYREYGNINYEIYETEKEDWSFQFTLLNVPNDCDKRFPLTYLTKNYTDEFHLYNKTFEIELDKILIMDNIDEYDKYDIFLYSNGIDTNFELFDQNKTELFLNKSIKFRLLKIKPIGENYSHRKIEIYFYTIYKDNGKYYPTSTLSSISFDLCGYGCNCTSADKASNYCNECLDNFAHFEDETEYCQEIEKLKSDKYVHNINNNSFIPCVAPCNTCENEVDNCKSCIDGYNEIKYQNLIKCCPPHFNYLNGDTKDCTMECNKQNIFKYYDEIEHICYKSCNDDNNKYTYNDEICYNKCPNYSYVIEIGKKCIFDLKISNQYDTFLETTMELKELYEKIDVYHIKYKELNNNVIGDNYALQVYELNEKITYNIDNISEIEFSSSFEKSIKKIFNLLDNESITVCKIDLLNENSVTNKVKIFLYDNNGRKLNIKDTRLNNLSYNIYFPLNKNISKLKLNTAIDLYNNNIDCYNINDSFFHEICYNNYYNNKYYDLKDRSKLYNNISICSGNCRYISLKKEGELKANCECFLSETNNNFNEKEEETQSNLIIEKNNSTIDYLKCYKYIKFKDLISNASFWFYSVSFSSTLICAFLYKKEMLKLYLLFANPPKFNYQSDGTYKDDFDINSKSFNRLKNSNDNIFKSKEFSINSKFNNIKKQYKKYIIPNSIIDFDNLPYDKVKNRDYRKLYSMFLKNIKEKIPLLRCIFNSNKYEIRTLKIIFYIFNFGIIYVINIIIIGKNINVKKSNDLSKIKTNLLRTIYIFLIYYLLIKITSKIYRRLLFKILIYQEYKNNFSNQRKKMQNILKQNLFCGITLFTIIIIIIIFCGIYGIIYYYIYKYFQNKLLMWFSFVYLISFILGLLISIILSICRYLSLIYKIRYLYNFNLLIKNMFDIF